MIPNEYRPEIDGLRAVAVLSVMFFHAGFAGFPGGFVGVDVFFVISGFLITGLIRGEIERTGGFSLSGFYLRRIRRLFPALLFTLTLSAVVAALVFSPNDLRSFAASAIATLLSVSNFHFWLESGYFDSAAELKPLLHTWSLGVEEQFYLVWPAILTFLAAVGLLRHASKIVGLLLVCGLALAWALQADRSASFYLAPFRVYELAIGAALCWAPSADPRRNLTTAAAVIAGLALIGYGVAFFDAETPFPALNALVPCLGAALVIWGGKGRTGRLLLGNPVAVWVGLISYSLYLIHWPALVFAKYVSVVELTVAERLGVCVLSLGLAAGMHRWIEQPFRLHRDPIGGAAGSRRFLFVMSIWAAIVALPMASAWQSGGWPQRVERDYDNSSAYAGNGYTWEGFFPPDGASRGTVVLFGDSHARQYASGIRRAANESDYALQMLTHSACMSLPGLTNVYLGSASEDCRNFHQRLLSIGDVSLVVVAYGWPKLVSVDGKMEPINGIDESPENLNVYLDAVFDGLSALLAELGDDVPVVVIGNVPTARLRSGYPWCADRPFRSAACHQSFPRAEGEFAQAIVRFRAFAAASRGRVWFLDPYESLCDDKSCFVVRDRTLYYSDHGHLTLEGAGRIISGHRTLLADAFAHGRRN